MKKYLPFAAMLLLAMASISFAQEPQATPSPKPKRKPAMTNAQLLRKLSATETKLWEAFKNKDIKPFKANLSADSVMVGEGGVSGKDSIQNDLAGCDVKSFSLSDWKLTRINSGAVLLTYKGSAVGTCAGTAIPTVWASSIWVDRGGKWMASFHQETPVKP